MNTHPYLRAYMAGAVVPTVFMIVVMVGFVILRYVCGIGIPLERGMVFPMAFVPNLFGLWNVLYVYGRTHHRTTAIGLHGAMLLLVLAPLGALVGSLLHLLQVDVHGIFYLQALYVPYVVVAIGFCCGLIVYYLVWKYVVGFLNGVLGIA